jgi:hypothetical protein
LQKINSFRILEETEDEVEGFLSGTRKKFGFLLQWKSCRYRLNIPIEHFCILKEKLNVMKHNRTMCQEQ